MAIGSQVIGSPFWQGYKEVCNSLTLDWGAVAWANLATVQYANYDSASFLNLPEEDQTRLADWQRELFQAMLRSVAPKMILAVTGPDYDWLISKMIPDLIYEPYEHDRASVRIGYSAEFDLKLARTYHPNYLQRSSQWPLLGEALALLRK